MKTVTLSVADRADVTRRALAAFGGKPQGARISFATPEILWQVLTERRWAILRVMAGQGTLSMREVARRLDRGVKRVHGDLRALIDAGVLEQNVSGVTFPYDAVHVDFTLRPSSLVDRDVTAGMEARKSGRVAP